MALGAKVNSTLRSGGLIRGSGYNEPAFQPGGPHARVTYCALWDNTVDGALPVQVSNGGMGLGVFIPALFTIVLSHFDVLVVPVGPTNMGASVEADFDLIASAAISGAPWSTTGMKNGVVIDDDAANVAVTTEIKTTVVREIQLVGTVAVSSAGRVALYVEGYAGVSATQGAS